MSEILERPVEYQEADGVAYSFAPTGPTEANPRLVERYLFSERAAEDFPQPLPIRLTGWHTELQYLYCKSAFAAVLHFHGVAAFCYTFSSRYGTCQGTIAPL